ncbi:hypothetical protein RMR10_011880 [Agrobacterium rosae]|uniref:hypothetical protein n=1 Tax=Agrobacterium rosae TaxID=1972867 RepID=UPI002A0C4A53|nr:hypothetical protein [Agrobacterium rosae]MDX8313327.1 hypothetical protein [Agrobacterium rosae]
MLRITKIALLWSLAIRALFLVSAYFLIDGYYTLPSTNYARFIGAQVGATLPPAVIGIVVAALFYYPKKNQWWEKRGILPAIITVCICHGLAILGEIF